MIRTVLLLSFVTGLFPFNICNGDKVLLQFSKLGLITNICSCAFLMYPIIVHVKLISEAICQNSPAKDIKLAIKITITIFQLIIVIRRSIRVKKEAETLNKLLSKLQYTDEGWYRKYSQVVVVFAMELCEMVLEYGIFSYIRVSSEGGMYTSYEHYDLTLLIRLGFEIVIVTVLMTEYHLYVFLNNLIRFDVTKNSVLVHNIRLKFDYLHSLRVRANECHRLDLLLYFVSTQLSMLLECFDLVKFFTDEDDFKMMKMVLAGIRIIRLFALLSYIIWRWCAVSNEVSI